MTYLELKYQVLRYYELNPDKAEEYKSELEYLKIAENFPEVIFPNESSREIVRLDYVCNDFKLGNKTLREVHVNGDDNLKIYFPSEYTSEDAINATALLFAEQSMESAHKYLKAPQNTTVFDVGASEGFFDRVYCDETNEIIGFDEQMWSDAFLQTTRGLDATFVAEFVDRSTKFDELPINKSVGCIKIDTEGMEIEVLEAFEGIIEQFHPMIQVAVYHYPTEADQVVMWLQKRGYKGFGEVIPGKRMLYHRSIQKPPYFRHGVIIATAQA